MIDLVVFEGLKEALRKGESLKQAMMSFYNAGYVKEQIEQAARALQMEQRGQPLPIQQIQSKTPEFQKKVKKPPQKKIMQPLPSPVQRVSGYGNDINRNGESIKKIKQGINSAINQLNRIEFPNGEHKTPAVTSQKVSDYGIKPKRKKIIIILAIFLVVLLGILGTIFLFKDSILNFFDNSSFFSGLFG